MKTSLSSVVCGLTSQVFFIFMSYRKVRRQDIKLNKTIPLPRLVLRPFSYQSMTPTYSGLSYTSRRFNYDKKIANAIAQIRYRFINKYVQLQNAMVLISIALLMAIANFLSQLVSIGIKIVLSSLGKTQLGMCNTLYVYQTVHHCLVFFWQYAD